MGCLTRVGCLVVVAAVGGVAWWRYGDRLGEVVPALAARVEDGVRDRAPARGAGDRPAANEPRDTRPTGEGTSAARDDGRRWLTLAPGGAATPAARDALAALRRRGGPAWQSLAPTDAAAALASLPRVMPATFADVAFALEEDQLLVRAALRRGDLAALAGDNALTALLGKALDGRDTVLLAGPVEPADAGTPAAGQGRNSPARTTGPALAWWRVRRVTVRGVPLPESLRDPLLGALRRAMVRSARERPAANADAWADALDHAVATAPRDALPLPLPAGVGDARVVGGRLTLYRRAGETPPTSGARPVRSDTRSTTRPSAHPAR